MRTAGDGRGVSGTSPLMDVDVRSGRYYGAAAQPVPLQSAFSAPGYVAVTLYRRTVGMEIASGNIDCIVQGDGGLVAIG